MSADTEDRLRDWGIWFTENKNRIPEGNLEKKNQFLTIAIDGCVEVMAMLAADIQKLEQRHGRNKLWLPNSVKLDNGPSLRLRD